MSKTSSAAVHELIKSLTKSEKRYFKIFSSRHTIGDKNNYIELFDYIANQDTYDEEALFKHFKGQAFLNKFSITKSRLYDSILRSLDGYYSTHSTEAQLYKQLHASSILYRKGLYQQSLKLLRSARKLAKKHDNTVVLMEVNRKIKKLHESCGEKCFDSEVIQKINKRDLDYSSTLDHYNKLWAIKGELFSLVNKGGKARSQEAIEKYEAIIREYKSLSFTGEKNFDILYLENHIWSAYYYGILEPEKCLRYLKNNLTLFEQTAGKIKEEPNRYFSILSNIIHLESNLNDYQSAIMHLNALKAFPQKYKVDQTVDLDIKLFSIVYSTEVMLYLKQGDFSRVIKLEKAILEGLDQFSEKIAPSRRAYFYFQMAVAFFGLEDYSKSLKWLNKLFNDTCIDDKIDIVSFSHLLNLVIHLEMENYRFLKYSLQRAKRFLKKRNRTFKFESIFLDYINKIMKVESKFDEGEVLENILSEIKLLKKDPFEKVALEYFDFESWVIARLKQKKFASIHKQNYLKTIQKRA